MRNQSKKLLKKQKTKPEVTNKHMTKVIKEDKFLKFYVLCAGFCDYSENPIPETKQNAIKLNKNNAIHN